MIKKSKFETKEWAWAYAMINGRFGDIYFEKSKGIKGIFAHGYLDNPRFKWDMHDKKLIKKDLVKNRLTYRKGKYRLLIAR